MAKKDSFWKKTKDNLFKAAKTLVIVLMSIAILFVVVTFCIHAWVSLRGGKYIVDLSEARSDYDAIIVLGAKIENNSYPSPMLKDRLDGALELYRAGVSDRILVSGDHREDNYNEVAVMWKYLLDQGVPDEAIFMDHYGLDTYDSMYRAHEVFSIDTAIVATQEFHLKRALYIARGLGFEYDGYATDPRRYGSISIVREYGARLKAIYEVNKKVDPTRLDPPIPITADGRQTREPWGEPWLEP